MPLQIPHPSTTLHLYRHLLREASYLPNLCRRYITDRIKLRTRHCRYARDPLPYVKSAHASLRFLRSANAGHENRLHRLFLMATGRVGRRCRVLSKASLAATPPSTPLELEAKRVLFRRRKPDWLDGWSVPMIQALAKSQFNNQKPNWPKTMRKTLDPEPFLAAGNVFKRPFAPVTVRNKTKKHWVSVLEQILPPLPQAEWDRLGRLARGEVDMDQLKLPARRPVAQCIQYEANELTDTSWDWSALAMKPSRVVQRASSRPMKSLTGMEDQDPRGHGRPIGLRLMTPRKLRRMYSRLWEMTPIINEVEERKVIKWGKIDRPLTTATTGDMLFFNGVTAQGKVPKKVEAIPSKPTPSSPSLSVSNRTKTKPANPNLGTIPKIFEATAPKPRPSSSNPFMSKVSKTKPPKSTLSQSRVPEPNTRKIKEGLLNPFDLGPSGSSATSSFDQFFYGLLTTDIKKPKKKTRSRQSADHGPASF
ncbi:hypothetical protein GGR57DRAFT_181256 [Xylariaceae sp. FL1272]|nr:hypothetical protein GGR57DRAFT_181256 [Xylariaceae sp. FL1272]